MLDENLIKLEFEEIDPTELYHHGDIIDYYDDISLGKISLKVINMVYLPVSIRNKLENRYSKGTDFVFPFDLNNKLVIALIDGNKTILTATKVNYIAFKKYLESIHENLMLNG
ncbi:hypothetical protein EHQ43_17440 [Leptospira bouyouniensis]|uniref:Uncharacterized protein n=1 Tax=Leptospira bouyouniensis TaxID=2484911 RepID=A0A7I0HPJ6_9LEPT|nr:hypothetical protein [Leptospira bouyouniensis]TGL03540.1 hypothetical protein EHQ43_17440 [Leptospira bouyouniensis]